MDMNIIAETDGLSRRTEPGFGRGSLSCADHRLARGWHCS